MSTFKKDDVVKVTSAGSRHFGKVGKIVEPWFPVSGAGWVVDFGNTLGRVNVYQYRLSLVETGPALAGPRPKITGPAFVGPFSNEGGRILDDNTNSVLRVDGQDSTSAQDEELAEVIVKFLNEKYLPAPEVPEIRMVARLVDSSGDDWFELQPGAWTMGGDSTSFMGGSSTRESLRLAKERPKTSGLSARSEFSVKREYGEKTQYRTTVQDQ